MLDPPLPLNCYNNGANLIKLLGLPVQLKICYKSLARTHLHTFILKVQKITLFGGKFPGNIFLWFLLKFPCFQPGKINILISCSPWQPWASVEVRYDGSGRCNSMQL